MLIVRRDRIDKFDHWNLGTYNPVLQAGIAPAVETYREVGSQAMHARLRELTRYWVALARRIPGSGCIHRSTTSGSPRSASSRLPAPT